MDPSQLSRISAPNQPIAPTYNAQRENIDGYRDAERGHKAKDIIYGSVNKLIIVVSWSFMIVLGARALHFILPYPFQFIEPDNLIRIDDIFKFILTSALGGTALKYANKHLSTEN